MASFIRYVWTQWMRTEAASFARGPARRSGGVSESISESSEVALDPRGRTAADAEV
jgi:hypothetical protein